MRSNEVNELKGWLNGNGGIQGSGEGVKCYNREWISHKL